MEKLRVIQWTTGKVGKLSMRGILDDPRLELVGVYAYSDEKAGVDAGALCGRPDIGVLATTDIEALIALGADTVIYTPFMADVDHAVRLLESGLDVISTNLFLNVGGIQGETKEKLAAACERGNSSLYITGINPGWINTMVTAMTAICRDVQMVSIFESADVTVYESAETWQALGFSLPEAPPEVIEMAKLWLSTFYDSVQRMGVALGYHARRHGVLHRTRDGVGEGRPRLAMHREGHHRRHPCRLERQGEGQDGAPTERRLVSHQAGPTRAGNSTTTTITSSSRVSLTSTPVSASSRPKAGATTNGTR